MISHLHSHGHTPAGTSSSLSKWVYVLFFFPFWWSVTDINYFTLNSWNALGQGGHVNPPHPSLWVYVKWSVTDINGFWVSPSTIYGWIYVKWSFTDISINNFTLRSSSQTHGLIHQRTPAAGSSPSRKRPHNDIDSERHKDSEEQWVCVQLSATEINGFIASADLKPYKCSLSSCPKRFARSVDRKRHEKTHNPTFIGFVYLCAIVLRLRLT